MGMYEFFSINSRVCILNDNSDIGTHILAPKRIHRHIPLVLNGTRDYLMINKWISEEETNSDLAPPLIKMEFIKRCKSPLEMSMK